MREHTGNIQPQLDLEEHVGDAKAKRVVLVGFDGANYNEAHVSAAGALSTTGGGGGGGGTVDQGLGGSSPWLVKIDQTGTNNDVNISGTVDVSGSTVTIQEPLSVDDNGGSLTVDGTVAVTDGGGSITVDGTVSVSGIVNVQDLSTLLDHTGFTQGASFVEMAGYIFDEVAGTALNENDGGAARMDVKRAQICTIEDETTRGRRATVTASNALKVDPSAVTSPVSIAGTVTTADNQTITDNNAFTDGTSKVFMAGYIFDETPGTALTENDAAAARIDSKRATISVIEDATTRGQRATVTASNALKVDGSAVTQPVSIAATVTVDTELETAAALADGQANPTLPRVGAIVLQGKYVDGTLSFDRVPHSYYQNRTSVGTASGAGTAIDMTMGPASKFGLEIENQSGTTSAWNINLEGSMDNATYFTILNQTSATGAANLTFIADKPVRFCRSNVTSVTGGGNVRVRILAMEH